MPFTATRCRLFSITGVVCKGCGFGKVRELSSSRPAFHFLNLIVNGRTGGVVLGQMSNCGVGGENRCGQSAGAYFVRDLSPRRALTSDKELSTQKYERSVLVFAYHCYAEGLEFEHAAHRRARCHFTSSLHQVHGFL